MEGRERWSKERVFYTDKIMQIGNLKFVVEIMNNKYDLILCALFDLEPVKRFECRSDM